jgi:hypothetical protein
MSSDEYVVPTLNIQGFSDFFYYERAPQDAGKPQVEESHRTPTEPAAMAAGNKKRPRLDLDAISGGARERKRGKSMFGILVGTLNKAKIEDKERNASEAVSSEPAATIDIRLIHCNTGEKASTDRTKTTD